MPRIVDIVVPGEQTDALIDRVGTLEGVMGIRVERGTSLRPPGDRISLDVLDRALPVLARLLDDAGVGHESGTSVATSRPMSLVSKSDGAAIRWDSSEATWEEADAAMARESNPTLNTFATMAAAGAVAVVGLAENALHLVIGAMVLAPGFEPIARAALGIVTHGPWIGAVVQTLKVYAALILGAAAAAVLLVLIGRDPAGSQGSYLPAGTLVPYWTTITPQGVGVSLVAAIAGAVLILTNRAVLTAGVMIALALVPGAAIAAVGVVLVDTTLATQGAARWLVDVALVAVGCGAVFALKQRAIHRRASAL